MNFPVPMPQCQPLPPTCGGDWGGLMNCWQQVAQFKQMIQEIVQDMPGVTDGSEAAPGTIGEFVEIDGITTINSSAVGPVYAVISTLNLSPGDWGVYSNMYTYPPITAAQLWVFLGPSSIPIGNTDNSRPSDGVAWFGADNPNIQVGGTLGPIRLLQSVQGGIDLRAELINPTAVTTQLYWTVSARRLR